MTDDELPKLQALCDAATPGPWRNCENGPGHVEAIAGQQSFTTCDGHWVAAAGQDDRHFIAAARTALPELIAEVRRLRRLLGAEDWPESYTAVLHVAALELAREVREQYKHGALHQLAMALGAMQAECERLIVLRDTTVAGRERLRAENESLKAELARLVLATGGAE